MEAMKLKITTFTGRDGWRRARCRSWHSSDASGHTISRARHAPAGRLPAALPSAGCAARLTPSSNVFKAANSSEGVPA